MTISSNMYLKGAFTATKALGDKAISSDAMLEIVGFEGMSLLIKSFPWPVLSSGGEIETPMPLGQAMYQPQQIKTHMSGGVTIMETVDGKVSDMLVNLLAKGGVFDAHAYEGTPQNHTRVKPLYGCFFVIDPAERDWENRSQQLNMTGQLHYHYFGDDE
jgi:hypothetical protein